MRSRRLLKGTVIASLLAAVALAGGAHFLAQAPAPAPFTAVGPAGQTVDANGTITVPAGSAVTFDWNLPADCETYGLRPYSTSGDKGWGNGAVFSTFGTAPATTCRGTLAVPNITRSATYYLREILRSNQWAVNVVVTQPGGQAPRGVGGGSVPSFKAYGPAGQTVDANGTITVPAGSAVTFDWNLPADCETYGLRPYSTSGDKGWGNGAVFSTFGTAPATTCRGILGVMNVTLSGSYVLREISRANQWQVTVRVSGSGTAAAAASSAPAAASPSPTAVTSASPASSAASAAIRSECKTGYKPYCGTFGCPRGLIGFGEHTYLRYETATGTWLGARTACQAAGGDLVGIGSAAEQEAVFRGLVGNRKDLWIGLSDTATEGTFAWADGSPLAYANWKSGQPDDDWAVEDCVEMNSGVFPRDGAWNDVQCDRTGQSTGFLCELPRDCGTTAVSSVSAATVAASSQPPDLSCSPGGKTGPAILTFDDIPFTTPLTDQATGHYGIVFMPKGAATAVPERPEGPEFKSLKTVLRLASPSGNARMMMRFVNPETKEKITVPANTLRLVVGRSSGSGLLLVRSFDFAGNPIETLQSKNVQAYLSFSRWHVAELEVWSEDGGAMYIDNVSFGPLACTPVTQAYSPPSSSARPSVASITSVHSVSAAPPPPPPASSAAPAPSSASSSQASASLLPPVTAASESSSSILPPETGTGVAAVEPPPQAASSADASPSSASGAVVTSPSSAASHSGSLLRSSARSVSSALLVTVSSSSRSAMLHGAPSSAAATPAWWWAVLASASVLGLAVGMAVAHALLPAGKAPTV